MRVERVKRHRLKKLNSTIDIKLSEKKQENSIQNNETSFIENTEKNLNSTLYLKQEIFNEFEVENEKTFLYESSNTTITDFFMAIYSIKSKHNLSQNSIDDFLKLFEMVLPRPNQCPKSYLTVEKKLNLTTIDPIKWSTCSKCQLTNEICNIEQAIICINCQNDLDHFVTFNVEKQIKQILSKEYLFTLLLIKIKKL